MIGEAARVGPEIEADVCIVGSGPAGISLALELMNEGTRVVMLEAGGLEPESSAQDLYRASQVGIRTDSLHVNRLRMLGGTSGLWGGWCRPLDAIDLEAREWVPHSGWPFGLEELAPHYVRAHEILRLDEPERSDADWLAMSSGEHGPALEGPVLRNIVYRFSRPPLRLGTHYREALERSANITVLLHANVMELECNETAGWVEAVRAVTQDGHELRVRARRTVVAAGAVESARLLLASDSVQKSGLGNGRDRVGRYFMQHPHVLESQLLNVGGGEFRLARSTGRKDAGVATAITPEAQREHRMLNYHFLMWRSRSIHYEGLMETAREAFRQLRHVYSERELEQDLAYFLDGLEKGRSEDRPGIALTTIAERPEQAPNPESRVTLGEERDALGMRRIVMDWRLTDLDRHTLRRARELLAHELGRLGLGRLRDWPEGLDPTVRSDYVLHGGNHHYGTTRMHDDPRQGVVDRSGRVHGIGNLYVAGSSVFPTTGYANPTLTIVALAVRLAAELRSSLEGG